MSPIYLLLTWVIVCIVPSALSLIAYDCGHRDLNVTSFSLTTTEPCHIPAEAVAVTNHTIQLVQLAKTRMIHVFQCLVELSRVITRCSWFNDAQAVLRGTASYVIEITSADCLDLHRNHAYTLFGAHPIQDIRPNSTTQKPVLLAGSLTYDGECHGSSYSDSLGSWDKVVVQGTLMISIRDFWVPVDLDTDSVVLPTGVRCAYNMGHCSDGLYSITSWEKALPTTCQGDDYDVLYHGIAQVLSSPVDGTGHLHNIVYSVDTGDTLFALLGGRKRKLCSQEAVETEHPRLFILVDTGAGFSKKSTDLDVHNADLFTYINSKFVYLERHLQRQITTMYRDLIHQKCLVEQEVLKQRLSLATISLSEFSYLQGQGPGYTSILGGEVIYLIKCQPVVVQLRKTDRCYQEVPVSQANGSRYMAPKTRILQDHGTEVSCSQILPNMYFLDKSWYSLTPDVRPAESPQTLKPGGEETWRYTSPGQLATSGIYTEEALNQLADHIMYPNEIPAITNTLARTVVHRGADRQDLMYNELLDEAAVSRIAQSTWAYIWGMFGMLGNLVAGFLGLYLIGRFAKFILDTILHGLMLYKVFGTNWRLAGSVWDSATNYIMHIHRPKYDVTADESSPESSQWSDKMHPSVPLREVSIEAPLMRPDKESAIYPTIPIRERNPHDIPGANGRPF